MGEVCGCRDVWECAGDLVVADIEPLESFQW